MARKAPKMTDMIIEETSGVDHPAHLHEGWLVIKAADTATVADVERTLPEPLGDGMSEEVTETVAEDAAVRLEAHEEEEKMGHEDEEQDKLAMAEARIQELEARIAEMESSDKTILVAPPYIINVSTPLPPVMVSSVPV